MRRKWTIGICALSALLAAATLWAWRKPHAPPRAAAIEVPRTLPQLTGTIEPAASIAIEPSIRYLVVPLNAWVRKGQVIGEADEGIGPDQADGQSGDTQADPNVVRAPVDGILVSSDLAAGKFGIARNASDLTVLTLLPAGNVDDVCIGQKATILVDGKPELQLTATVSEIADLPVASQKNYYPVTLNLENPSGLRLAGVSVTIQLRPATSHASEP